MQLYRFCFIYLVVLFSTCLLANHDYAEYIEAINSTEILNPVRFRYNPYEKDRTYWEQELKVKESHFCGVRFANKGKYEIKTFASMLELEQSGYHLTHHGACGTCSTLADLAVYMGNSNLTASARRCSMLAFNSSLARSCYRMIGLSNECAYTWTHNSIHTGRKCAGICVRSWLVGEDYNRGNGDLNRCLACDEHHSGPAFKSVAGRTRRSSGLISEITRADEEIAQINHDYLINR